jgi:hypothetical protein
MQPRERNWAKVEVIALLHILSQTFAAIGIALPLVQSSQYKK